MAATTTLTAHGVHHPIRSDLWTRLTALITRFETWAVDQRRYQVTVRQLSALNDQILADIGLERGDIRSVAQRLVSGHRV